MDDTRAVGAKISSEQFQILEGLQQSHGYTYMSELVRSALEQYVKAHNLTWPDYEFVDNLERSRRKIRGRGT